MIYSISADKESFNTVRFKNGFNVVLAEKTRDSTSKDSRNGLGKSSMIDIIHFCLGGMKAGTLSNSKLNDWTFTVTLDIGGLKYSVSRNTARQGNIFIHGDCKNWNIQPNIKKGLQFFKTKHLKQVLGAEMYGTATDDTRKYGPTFRSLISYNIRRSGKIGGYLKPFKNSSPQREWDIQVNSAYLLGLGWELAADRQILRDRLDELSSIKRSATEGILSDVVGDEGMLEANRIRLEEKVRSEYDMLAHFKIHKEYDKLENETNKITKKLHDLSDMNVIDKKVLNLYKLSLIEEIDVTPERIADVYKEAGFLFPDSVTARLESVQTFHKKIVQNRKKFLGSEITRLTNVISDRKLQSKVLDDQRSKIMEILKTHGALDEFSRLQERHSLHVSELETIVKRLELLKKIKAEKNVIMTEISALLNKMEINLVENKKQRENAITTFNLYSEHLYDASGDLSISASESGYKFDVKIERSNSQGYGMMQIFCYDLMLAKLWTNNRTHPGFLIHDSTIFEGVDERQIAHAIRLADLESKTHGYQYICMMNSDLIPRDVLGDFDLRAHVAATFTDATSNGGLLGIRF